MKTSLPAALPPLRLCASAFTLSAFILHPSAFAQSMADKSRLASVPVSLSCVRSASGGRKAITWQTDYGSSARDIARTLTYDCSVRWSGRHPTNAVLEALFIAKPAAGGAEFIASTQTHDLQLTPGSNQLIRVTSEAVDQSKATYAALGMKDAGGAKLRGAVVRLLIDNQPVRAYWSLGHWQAKALQLDFQP